MQNLSAIIRSVGPSHASGDVSIHTPVTVGFRTHLAPGSITTASIQLNGAEGAVPVDIEYDGRKKMVTLMPRAPLAYDSLYTLNVNGGPEGVRTVLGEELAGNFTIFFQTEQAPKEVVPEDDVVEDLPEELTDGVSEEELDAVEEDEEESSPETEPVDEDAPEQAEVIYDSIRDIDLTFRVKESYPSPGGIHKVQEGFVLVFNKDIDSSSLAERVYLKQAHVHPLMEKMNQAARVPLSVQATEGAVVSFSPASDLLQGEQYELVVLEGVQSTAGETLESDVRIPFQTNWARMFADVSDVRLVLGSYSDSFTDAEIGRLINQHSNNIYQLMSMTSHFDEADWGVDAQGQAQYPYAAGQYVIYSAAYQGMLGQMISSSSGNASSISLADLSVRSEASAQEDTTALLDLLQNEIDRWWRALNGDPELDVGEEAKPKYIRTLGSATRAISDHPYPEFHTRVPFEDLGGGS